MGGEEDGGGGGWGMGLSGLGSVGDLFFGAVIGSRPGVPCVGDLLEASVENGTMTITPQSLVEKHIAAGLADLDAGRTHGPYDTAAEATCSGRTTDQRAGS